MRIDTLSGIFAASVSAYLVYGGKVSAGAAGFTISVVLGFSRQMIWWVRIYNLLEIQGKASVMRCNRSYSDSVFNKTLLYSK